MSGRTYTFLALLLALSASGAHAQLTQSLGGMLDEFRWRSVGPTNMGGRVTDVEGLPSPSKTFYVAGAGSGIWKTTNNGTTFEQIWTHQRVISMGDLAISPSDPDIIWAGTGEEDSRNSISPGGGIFKSTDGGETWNLMGLEATQVIARIIVHPTNPDIVHVAALGHIWDSNPERGMYRTRDGGETWELVKFISDRAGFVDLVMDPRNPDVLFAAAWERVRGPYFLQSGGPGSGLWKTEDGGDSWTEVSGEGFPTSEKGRIGLGMSRSNPDIVYALVEARGEGEVTGFAGNGLYRSDDGGDSWEKMNDTNTRPFYYSQVRVDPQDPDRVYFSSTPVQVSDDGGRTFGQTTARVHVDHHAMWIDPNDPERIVVGNDGGVAITYDRGGNWSYLNHVTMGQFYDISLNMDVPYRVCGGLQDNGTWCGPSRLPRGDITAYHWASISGGDGFVSAQDPVDPNIVWSESQQGNMGRLNLATGERQSLQRPDWRAAWLPYQDSIVMLMDEGVNENDGRIRSLRERATADSLANNMRWNWNTPFLQSTHDRSHFYAAGSMVVKSTDWGSTLEPISPDLTYADPDKIDVATRTTGGLTPDVTGAENYATIVALDESTIERGRLYVGTDDGRVWMTEDDGGTWSELTDRFDDVPDGTYVSRVKASGHDPRRVYVTFDGHRTNDFTPYVFVSDDNGASFRSIAAGLPTGSPDFVHVIEEDPVNPNVLFVGTDVGAYVSTDRGRTWQRFMNGLPAVPVHDLEVHPRDKELVAATHGRSIWIVDIAPLQELTDAVIADGALFTPKPAYQFGFPARGGESYAQQHWGRPSPSSEAEFTYFLSEELAQSAGPAGAGREGARAGGRGGRAGGPPGRGAGRGRRGGGGAGPQVDIVVTDSDGQVVTTLSGPATPGLHRVEWDLRGEAPAAADPSIYEQREQAQRRERALIVQDSLIDAGWDEETLRPIIERFTGEATGFPGGRGGFGGRGGAGGGDPEAFQERPGEQFGGGGRRGGFGQMREIAEIVQPGMDLRSIFRRGGGGGGGGAPLVEPGTYTVTMTVGDRTFTRELTVGRAGDLSGNNAPFEEGRQE